MKAKTMERQGQLFRHIFENLFVLLGSDLQIDLTNTLLLLYTTIVIILTSDALPDATAFFPAWDHQRVEENKWLRNSQPSNFPSQQKEAKKKIQIEHVLIVFQI